MATHTITNKDVGPRGFWHQNAVVTIEAGQSVDVSDMTVDEVKAAKKAGYFTLEGDDGVEPGPLDGSVDDLAAYLKVVTDADAVQKLLDAETGGKSRKGAITALEARRDELLA